MAGQLSVRITVHQEGQVVESAIYSRFPVRIGFAPGNDLVLSDRRVSAEHGELTVASGQLCYRDLESTNGSFVGGQRILQHTLGSGDIVEIRPFALSFEAPSGVVKAAPSSADVAGTAGALGPSTVAGSTPGTRSTTKARPSEGIPLVETTECDVGTGRRAQEDDRAALVGRLRVVEGPDGIRGRVFLVGRAPFRIGRLETAELRVDVETVSREHALLKREGDGHWRLEDLESANGTSVNGNEIHEATLESGDRIRLGPDVVLEFSEARQQETVSPAVTNARLSMGLVDDELPTDTSQLQFLRVSSDDISGWDPIGVVRVEGSVDSVNYTEFDQRLRGLVDRGKFCLVVNVSRMSFIDHAGLGVLYNFAVRLKELDGQLRLVGVGERLAETLSLTRLDTTIFASRIDADEQAAISEVVRFLARRRPRHG